jgi:hypothetical protein
MNERAAYSNDQLKTVEQVIDSLTKVDFTDTAEIEVQLDAVASALLKLKESAQQRLSKKTGAPDLGEILSLFIEDGELRPVALSDYDVINSLMLNKEYEGYSEDYLSERLEGLLTDFANELKSTIKKLHSEAQQ